MAAVRSLHTAARRCNLGFHFSEEQQALREVAEAFARARVAPGAAHHDTTRTFPWAAVKAAHEVGLGSLHIPTAYGGLGLGHVETSLVAECLAFGCAGVASVLGSAAAATVPVLASGSDAQKRALLGPLAAEPSVAARCDTRPYVAATRVADAWVLDGRQELVVGAAQAAWYFVLAQTGPRPEHLTGFVVDANALGVRLGAPAQTVGLRAAVPCDVTFAGVHVPDAFRLGDVGGGAILQRKTVNYARLHAAASAVGLAARALAETAAFVRERGTASAAQQAAPTLACMTTGVEAGRWLVRHAAWKMDQGHPATIPAAIAKSFCGDLAMDAATGAIQLLGHEGCRGERPAEKLLRDATHLQVAEGTPQALRALIGRLG